MTANDMKVRFLIKFGKLFDFGAPAYDDRQISQFLTDAQWRIFLQRYNPFGNKYKKGFENGEQRTRDLEQLLKPALYLASGSAPDGVGNITKPVNQNGVHPGGIFLEMPSDFLYTVEETVKLDSSSKETIVKPKTHDEYSINVNNPFSSPYEDLCWSMSISRYQQAIGTSTEASANRVEVIIPSGSSLDQYRCIYLAAPPDIVVDTNTLDNQRHCILSVGVHQAIVDEAVTIADSASKQGSYQVSLNEGLRSE